MDTTQNIIKSVGGIVTAGAMTLSNASADIVMQKTDKEQSQAAVSVPYFFGEQSASVVAAEPQAVSANKSDLEIIFNGLAKNWREATGGYSLTMRRYAHTSYQSILALEPKRDVISLILRELQQRPDRWFEALKALTNANPAQDAKTFDETVQRWIEWGKRGKYIS